jgi:hypothetical protein
MILPGKEIMKNLAKDWYAKNYNKINYYLLNRQ